MINLHKPYFNIQNDLINIKNILNTKWISSGKYNSILEKKLAKFFSKRYSATASSWTTAAYLLLKILDIKKGDLVMLPAFTFIACANVVRQVGADVVFVDIGENDVNMDFEDLKRKFSKRVKCIMIVDQIGVPIEVEKYIKFCRKEKIHLIHDIACSLGSKYKKVPSGSSSEFLITSFHARKVITSGEGGALICNSKKIINKFNSLKSHGVDFSDYARKNSKYKIKEKFKEIGFNFRYNDLQAALCLSQFNRINKAINIKKKIANFYIKNLNKKFVNFINLSKSKKLNWQSFLIYFKDKYIRDLVYRNLIRNNIECKCSISSCYNQKPYFGNLKKLNRTKKMHDTSLLIPMHPYLIKKDLKKIVGIINSVY